MRTARTTKADGPDALGLIEEAVHLLRTAPRSVLVLHLSGTAPFVLGLLYFWSHTTWFAPTPAGIAWGACGLTLAFALMKGAQAEFCARLMAHRLGSQPAPLSAGRLARSACRQLRLQAWGFLLLPVSLVLSIPFGWVYAYYQGLSATNDSESPHAEAMHQAQLWPLQNHLGILLFTLLAAAVWINMACAVIMIPQLAGSILGIENPLGLTPMAILNTTVLAAITAVSWLVVDPLVKACYTLRVFHGRSRSTGEDLRVALQSARRAAGASRALAALLTAAMLVLAPRPSRAAEAPAAPAPGMQRAVEPARLDASIREALEGRNFRWRLRPLPREEAAAGTGGPIMRFVAAGVEMIRDLGRTVMQWISDFIRWLMGRAPGSGPAPRVNFAALQSILYVATGLLVAILIYLLWRRRGDYRRPVPAVPMAATPVPDLEDERTRADQLSVEGWLAMAREQMAGGELRLAWRALYLATLARLAAEGLVSLSRSKTNLDYEREVRCRAADRAEIAAAFSGRRSAFESVWYGRGQPDETHARRWLSELEGRALP